MAETENFDRFHILRVDREVSEPSRRLSKREMATLLRRGADLNSSGQLAYHQQSGTHLDVNRNN